MIAAEVAGDAYLDYIAKPPEALPAATVKGEDHCRQWSSFASCTEGHLVARSIFCRREWCADCGREGSDAHKQRWVRWLPKAQQLSTMGYLVITFPLEQRERLRSKKGLADVAEKLKDALINAGYSRGLRRWHYFGECPIHPHKSGDEGVCKCSRRYHPHLNYLLESGAISKKSLRELKQLIYKTLGFRCVIHYQWTDKPPKIMHLLKYVTRPTFLDRSWDNDLADNLYGYRTTQSWGTWKDAPVWTLDQTDEDVPPEVLNIVKGYCPYCPSQLTYQSKVVPMKFIKLQGFADLSMGFHGQERRPPIRALYPSLDRECYT